MDQGIELLQLVLPDPRLSRKALPGNIGDIPQDRCSAALKRANEGRGVTRTKHGLDLFIGAEVLRQDGEGFGCRTETLASSCGTAGAAPLQPEAQGSELAEPADANTSLFGEEVCGDIDHVTDSVRA